MDNSIINYEKRKNTDLFKTFEKEELTYLSNVQNYIPIYNRFFILNESNYNSINLNHDNYLVDIKNNVLENKNIYNCVVQNINTNKKIKKHIFFKMAPLLDPFKFLIGKYNINDPSLYSLPSFSSKMGTVNPKILDTNNSAYIDGFFSFLSSLLIKKYNFINGVDYYGSFLAIKKDFKINIVDDLEYLCKSDFFNKNQNKLFKLDDYSFLFENMNQNETKTLQPIKIHKNDNSQTLSVISIDDNLFENIFDDSVEDVIHLTLTDLKDSSLELVDITSSLDFSYSKNINISTIKSNSTCSSRTSHTDDDNDETCDNCSNDSNDSNWEDVEDSSYGSYQEQCIYATLKEFPVQVICMDNCEDTFDNLIINNELTNEEWFSALMQIIMILITYQKVFSFTHNDLHTNNVMYNKTDIQYIYYFYKKKYYKVPTFGRIFKIIDFGRAIYKFDGKLFCSDCFQPGADAATQYNIEPYFNNKKPRLEPNNSFDLCRLACSIFDYVIDDLDEITDLDKCEPIVKIIFEWCLDDNGINILYKNNGVERYPDFKLYKMISRCVHNHTPQAQLERPEFNNYLCDKSKISNHENIINIDLMNVLTNEKS